MKKKSSKILGVALTIALLASLTACGGEPTAPATPTPTPAPTPTLTPKPTITTSGKEAKVSSETIKPSGGVIAVDKPGDPLDGFEIDVPAGAYEETRTFKVSYKVVESHAFGEYFHPISPLITVDNGGYSGELMTIKIPVEIPDGHFAMAFFYDEKAGTLEGMPLIDVEQDSITVATTYFSNVVVSSIVHYLLPDEDGNLVQGLEI